MKPSYPSDDSLFQRALSRRADDYLAKSGRFADRFMLIKGFVHIGLAGVLYWAMLSDRFVGVDLVLLMILFGFNQFMIALNVAHDASHGAYASRRWINRWLTRTFDLIGINSYIWEYNHVRSHHRFPNVPLLDSAIDSFAVMSLHPRSAGGRIRRFQHLYVFLLYSVSTLFKFYFLDFYSFLRRRIGGQPVADHGATQIALLVISKIIVLSYSLLIPLWVVDAPPILIFAGYLGGHLASGVALALIFQVTHLSDRTVFPEAGEDGAMPYPYSEHILRTTADFSTRSPLTTWIAGGLNLHVAHHLFPHVCHTRLPALTAIVAETAAEFGLPYRAHGSVWEALVSHVRLLERLGRR